MHKQKLYLPIILSSIYVLLSILAFSFHIVMHETDKYSAIFIGILTMPWSFFESLFHDLIISTILNYEFSYTLKNFTMSVWVILNATLIFFIVRKLNMSGNKD